jgi:hypothetical protein
MRGSLLLGGTWNCGTNRWATGLSPEGNESLPHHAKHEARQENSVFQKQTVRSKQARQGCPYLLRRKKQRLSENPTRIGVFTHA